MPADKYDVLGPMLSDIGREMVAIVGGKPDDIWLYVEAEEGVIYSSLFKDQGNSVVYYNDPDDSPLTDLIIAAREAESDDPVKRWATMEYEISNGRFETRFRYADQVDLDDITVDRREVLLKQRYGDKPVVYPELLGGKELERDGDQLRFKQE